MSTYIMLSRISPDAIKDPGEFKKMAEKVTQAIRTKCPGVTWKESFATLGRFDVVDILESEDPAQVHKAAVILRSYGHETTETLKAAPWKEFLSIL